jgi:mono/diheme cytochrome c family protein
VAGVMSILATAACGEHVKSGGPVSTREGVYSAEQASRGKDIYLAKCSNCHDVASHTGTTFAKFWDGHRLSELYQFIGLKMPKNEPGTLSEQETADLIAYILKLNTMPVGKNELPADSLALDRIHIDLPKAAN